MTLQEILYYVTIQFATTCNYLSFVITFYGVPIHFTYTKVFWTTLRIYLTCSQGT
jgi:hypothetical protein